MHVVTPATGDPVPDGDPPRRGVRSLRVVETHPPLAPRATEALIPPCDGNCCGFPPNMGTPKYFMRQSIPMDNWIAWLFAAGTVGSVASGAWSALSLLRRASARDDTQLIRRAADGQAMTSALAEVLGLESESTRTQVGENRFHTKSIQRDPGGSPPDKGPSSGPQTVLAASTASWKTENESLTSSATSRRKDARRYSQIAAWVGVVGAAFFVAGILWAVVSGSAVNGLSALIGLLPGGLASLVLDQARQATADARSDEAELRAQVDYQRRAAYAWEVVHSVSDPEKRDDALRALAVALAPRS